MLFEMNRYETKYEMSLVPHSSGKGAREIIHIHVGGTGTSVIFLVYTPLNSFVTR
jgi:hypothetical protein